MRARFLLLICASTAIAAPLSAQGAPPASQAQLGQVDKRVTVLESQMRAVQRQVFPGGDKRFFEPEVPSAPLPDATMPGTPATSPLVDLTQRVTALETQQRALTGQIEQLQFQMRQLESAFQKLKGDSELRLDTLEGKAGAPAAAQATPQSGPSSGAPGAAGAALAPARAAGTGTGTATGTGAAAAAATTPPKPSPSAGSAPAAAAVDPVEARYREGYALYTAGDYPAAYKALSEFVAANPKHARASNAQFWAGRSLLAQGRTADAAKAFLAGYQKYPRGERAHNSLLWLGKSLVDLKQPTAACQALDQLKTAYPDRLVGQFAADTAATRAQAKCAD
jgi:tol-pal system protein YbgF